MSEKKHQHDALGRFLREAAKKARHQHNPHDPMARLLRELAKKAKRQHELGPVDPYDEHKLKQKYPLPPRPGDLGDQGWFRDLCNDATKYTNSAYDAFQLHLIPLTKAYVGAVGKHKDLLKRLEEKDKLTNDIMFGMFLAFVPGFGARIVGLPLAQQGHPYLADGIQDLVKWGARYEGTRNIPSPPKALSQYPLDPLLWVDEHKGPALKEKLFVQNVIDYWKEKNDRATVRFDILSFVKDITRVGGSEMLDIAEKVNVAADQTEFEKLLLLTWAKSHGKQVEKEVNPFS